jgi:hypothetical protein
MKSKILITLLVTITYLAVSQSIMASDNPNPPTKPIRLVFIHHSTGSNWLSDANGKLGIMLRNNNYYVSDTNYGWGPYGIGDRTDIGNWWEWFRDPDNYVNNMKQVYLEYKVNSDDGYSRLALNPDPSGENKIIMFKSCFPNSALRGNPNDPVPPINSNPLRGQSSDSQYHTVANAKGIYIDILEYFKLHQEKLFIVITAPPLTNSTYASNARAFNLWLVNNWLQGYPYKNVFVYDFYNVLTTNGGNANTNDLNSANGNHHRWYDNAVQHKSSLTSNTEAYPSDDDHPSMAGNLKATSEFVPLLNVAYNRWRDFSTGTATEVLKSLDFSAYPNPFSEKVTIRYQVSATNSVRLVIYDVSGKQVFSRTDQIQQKGEHSLEFDANHMPDGMYKCILEAGNQKSSLELLKINH